MDNVIPINPPRSKDRESLRAIASALSESINLAKCQVNCIAHTLMQANNENDCELQAQAENVLLAHVGFMQEIEERFGSFESRLLKECQLPDDEGAEHG